MVHKIALYSRFAGYHDDGNFQEIVCVLTGVMLSFKRSFNFYPSKKRYSKMFSRKTLIVSCGFLGLCGCDSNENVVIAPTKEVVPAVKLDALGNPENPNFDRDAAVRNITDAVMQSVRDPDGAEMDKNLREILLPVRDDNDNIEKYMAISYVRVENKYGGHEKLNFIVRVKLNGDIIDIESLGVY